MRLTSIALILLACPVFAEGEREHDSHEHGVGTLNIAFDGTTVQMEFEAPGADIVGFEHEATTAEDKKAIDDAVAALSEPLKMFSMPDDAECKVIEANAELHGDHGQHTEFHAEYVLECASLTKMSEIGFPYFDRFPNAREVEVQMIGDGGAKAFEVERDEPVLDVQGMI